MSNLTTSTEARGGQGTRGVSMADLPLAGTRGRQRAAGTGERFDAHLERAIGDGERPDSGPDRSSDDSAAQTRGSDKRTCGDDRRVDATRRDPHVRRSDRRSDSEHTADRSSAPADAGGVDAGGVDTGDRADEASERSDEHDVVDAPVGVEPAAPSIAATPADAAATLAVAVLPSLAPIGPETTSPVTTGASATSGEAVAEIAGPADSSDAVTIGGTASGDIAMSPVGADPSGASTASTSATSTTASDATTLTADGVDERGVDAADTAVAGTPATGSPVDEVGSATGAGPADVVSASQRPAAGASDPNPVQQSAAADPSAASSSTDDSAVTVPTAVATAASVAAPAAARVSPSSNRDSGTADGRPSTVGAAVGAAGALQTSASEGDAADTDARGRGNDAGATTPITASAGATPRGSSFDSAVASFEGELATTQAGDPAASERTTRPTDLLRTPGLDRMSIDLSDEGLGPLTLQAANGVGGLQLRLTAGDRAVGDALAASAHELRRELEASGTQLGSLDVGHRDTPAQGGRDGRAGQGTPWRSDRSDARPDVAPVRGVGPLRPVDAASGGLDLRI